MATLPDYQVRFLDARGNQIEDVTLLAKCLTLAISCADIMGPEIGADSYYITADGRKITPEWWRPVQSNETQIEHRLVGCVAH